MRTSTSPKRSCPPCKELEKPSILRDEAEWLGRGKVEEVPGEPGLRIAVRPEGEQRTAFELTIAAIPAEDDEVVEKHGAHVFLDPEAASYLEDKVLDARVEGNQVGFALLEQE